MKLKTRLDALSMVQNVEIYDYINKNSCDNMSIIEKSTKFCG
jgi:hypothetical protein